MLTPVIRTPAQVVNVTFRRQKPTQDELTHFQTATAQLLANLNPAEDEENAKKRIGAFLEMLMPDHDFNNRSKRDFVMRRGPKSTDPVGVIFEMKHLSKKAEMPTSTDLNRRAMHQLVYYFMQDRQDHSGDELTHLIITDGRAWWVFDAHEMSRVFWDNAAFRKQFRQFEAGGYTSTKKEFFYDDIARPFIAAAEGQLPVAYFNLTDKASPTAQIQLLKLLSPTHLLRLPLPGADGNTLNRAFYTELLYLMGLEEVPDKGRKLIRRCAPERRQPASLLENAIDQLRAENLLERLPEAERDTYGATPAQQHEEIALALCLTWVSRLLFLKLLEGQLRRYHGAQGEQFRFLHPDHVQDYDHLNRLFYRVLNRPLAERGPREQADFARIPYLNSTLFEPAALEQATLRISNLDDRLALPLLAAKGSKSVLEKDPQPPTAALSYLLRFLEAYDFSSEGAEEVQAQAKPLISASVLGLIFEKINGYRDGSFYTPGFVTMYMCQHTLRRAVVQHFNRAYPACRATTIQDLRDFVQEQPRDQRPALARHFGCLRLCDPAVGSGHFLVSALNELLVIKAELRLIVDAEGTLPFRLSIDRDELIVRDADDNFVPYRATYNPATGQRTVGADFTRFQQALFREKRLLLEQTLFGVDLNPNSVRICRLRLWIELLKHAYYRPDTGHAELEVLPNLDLNIQPGNSLLGRFPLHEDLDDVFRDPRYSLAAYQEAVKQYFSVTNYYEKLALRKLLADFKQHTRNVIARRDPLNENLRRLDQEIMRHKLDSEPDMYGIVRIQSERHARSRARQLREELEKAEAKLRDQEARTAFRDAFEWRFEFPEILHEDGSFRGFDVVLGNPPYIRQEEVETLAKKHLQQHYTTGTGAADLYVYFYEMGLRLLAPGGELSFITNNKWLRAGYGEGLRGHLLNPEFELLELIDFGDLPVFPDATTYPNILSVRRAPAGPTLRVAELSTLATAGVSFEAVVAQAATTKPTQQLSAESWHLGSAESLALLGHLRAAGTPLGEYVDGKIYRGIITGYNEAFVIDAATRARLVAEDQNATEVIVPFLAGRDLKRYQTPHADKYLILLEAGWTRAELGWRYNLGTKRWTKPAQENHPTPWAALETRYPSVARWLAPFAEKAAARADKGHFWWELRACDYYGDFGNPKIIFPDIAPVLSFSLDTGGNYLANTGYFLPTDNLYLLGVLNSASIDTVFRNLSATIRGGYLRFFKQYLEQLPIPPASAAEQATLAGWVQEILTAKAADPAADTGLLEQRIDTEVARLFGLPAAPLPAPAA